MLRLLENLLCLQRSYLKTVLDEIRSSERDDSKAIHIRLLVSIDRRKGVQDALDTLALVEELRDEYGGLIVGENNWDVRTPLYLVWEAIWYQKPDKKLAETIEDFTRI